MKAIKASWVLNVVLARVRCRLDLQHKRTDTEVSGMGNLIFAAAVGVCFLLL